MEKRQLSIIFLVSVLIITTLACSRSGFQVNTSSSTEEPSTAELESTKASTDEPSSTHTPAPTKTQTQAPIGSVRSKPVPAGSEITADGMTFLVKSVIRPADRLLERGYSSSNKPEEGQEYIFVDLSLTCAKSSDGKCSFNRYYTGLVGSKGIKRAALYISFYQAFYVGTPTPTPEPFKILEEKDFYGGASVSGYLGFLVDKDETDLLFVYEYQDNHDDKEIYMSLPEPMQ
jgi:hypothetical protein